MKNISRLTLRELREYPTTLSQQVEAQRDQFRDALQAMDYDRALECQKRLERLEHELFEVSSRIYRLDSYRLWA